MHYFGRSDKFRISIPLPGGREKRRTSTAKNRCCIFKWKFSDNFRGSQHAVCHEQIHICITRVWFVIGMFKEPGTRLCLFTARN